LTRTQRLIAEHRQGDAAVRVRDGSGRPRAGVPVWVEQESHEFVFGCVVPDLGDLPAPDRARYHARLGELFNRVVPAGAPSAADAVRVEPPDRVHLGVLRVGLDRLAAGGMPLEVHVDGRTVGLADRSERDAAHRLAELYTLCFAHPAVRGIFWNGFWEGEEGVKSGLLRRDLSPTTAFRHLQKLIDVVWHTRAAGVTDAAGVFRFRGFHGDYRVGIQVGERMEVSRLSLRRGSGESVLDVAVPAGGDKTPPQWGG
jgi:hypothetical protein